MAAIITGHADCLEILLKSGANPNLSAAYHTPATLACVLGRADCLDLLIKHCADLTMTSMQNGSPMFIAAGYGHSHCVELLHRHGATIHAEGVDLMSPIMASARNGHTNTVKLLLDLGADPNTFTSGGRDRGSGYAGSRKHVDKHGWTCLMHAAARNHLECMDALMSAGANLDDEDHVNSTALQNAIATGKARAVIRLLDAGATVPSLDYCAKLLSAEFDDEQSFSEDEPEFGYEIEPDTPSERADAFVRLAMRSKEPTSKVREIALSSPSKASKLALPMIESTMLERIVPARSNCAPVQRHGRANI